MKRAAIGLLAGLLAGCVAAAPAGARALKGMWGPAVHAGASQFPVYRDLGVQLFETAIDWARWRPGGRRTPATRGDRPTLAGGARRGGGREPRVGMRVAVQLIGAPPWANGGRPPNWAPPTGRLRGLRLRRGARATRRCTCG